ncbi:succinate dehydrogenase, hydrophobic membrane anchor protein [Pseudoalteromonas luteoviolacea]|uniref:Succinate dehydrogenase, hydrophobic membrane anchor protein n=1 Tax=Pseudoalteromonas luteoviolacea TaxID=43657 RepID=A0A1C0TPI7_9GAMM|nr:succinate dehydrogenase, hydrophobic membrane anchor protein [Pseudoalteromonas luteoviolacea]MBQ4811810.1 succinate dehydrogenase, hydrophobic membrane anchor protein [Pseudoalteromonas luteoviolacea]OCQ20852.1 succinate dehydrogenase, hydrophobic membrane anchor protein [Pseudoalteromonas luteoviolacea]
MAIMNIARSGTKQWVLQRISNAIIVAYSILIVVLLLSEPVTSHQALVNMFTPMWFKVLTTLSVCVFAFNGVIAGWQIAGDYVQGGTINKIFNLACVLLSLSMILTMIKLIWL